MAMDCPPESESRPTVTTAMSSERGAEEYRLALSGRISTASGRINSAFVEGMLILTGEAGSYYHKQMAQECAWLVPGVERVVNRVTVVRQTV